jgi:hypothetical protein
MQIRALETRHFAGVFESYDWSSAQAKKREVSHESPGGISSLAALVRKDRWANRMADTRASEDHRSPAPQHP